MTLSLIRQQVRVQRALALEPQSSATLAATPPEGMTAEDVPVAIAVLAAAKHIEIDADGRWCLRGLVGKRATPEQLAVIESTCRTAELSADAFEASQRGELGAAAKAMAAMVAEAGRGIVLARAADAARRK